MMNLLAQQRIIEAAIQRHAGELTEAQVDIDARFFEDLGRALSQTCLEKGLDRTTRQSIERALERARSKRLGLKPQLLGLHLAAAAAVYLVSLSAQPALRFLGA